MNAPTTAIDRFYDLCDEFERRFGESFWMPAGCGLSTADGIYAIKSAIEAGECRRPQPSSASARMRMACP